MIHSGLGGGSSMPQQAQGHPAYSQQSPSFTSPSGAYSQGNINLNGRGLLSGFGVSDDYTADSAITYQPPTMPTPRPSQDWEGIAFLLLGLM